MKTNILLTIIVFSLLLSFTSTVSAQGTAFTYQGQLQNSNAPAAGTYDMTFALYNASSGGAQVGLTITSAGMGISNGLFTTVLDFGAVYNGTSYWLQIGVRTNGGGAYTPLTPRQELTPSPYAITAENLDGTLLASQLTGTLPTGLLSGLYGNSVNFNNPGDNFVGNGAGLANVNATSLNGLNATNFWQLNGNIVAGSQFLGSVNNQAVEIHTFNTRALRIEPGLFPGLTNIPNIIAGSPGNFVAPGSVGNVIGGGSDFMELSTNFINAGNYNTIGGGWNNHITNGAYDSTIAGGQYNSVGATGASIGGGTGNTVTGPNGTVPGGNANLAAGSSSFAAGQDAQALQDGTFVWADSSSFTPFSSSAANQFLVRAQFMALNRTTFVTGSDVFDVGSPATSFYGGMYVDTAGAGGWPFYGYSQAGAATAWTYVDASDTNSWKLNVAFQDRVTVTTAGRVGINTTAPRAQLHVQEGSAATGLSDAFGPNGGPGIWSDTTDTDAIFASTKGGGAYAVYAIASDNATTAVTASANNTNAAASGYGVSASTTSTNGAGVIAFGANAGSPALTIGNGGLRVANAGIDTATAAFIHVATAGNTSSYITTISNPLTDGDPNAILIVTHQFSPPGIAGNYETHPFSVWYNGVKWTIYHDDLTAIQGLTFNVLVIKH